VRRSKREWFDSEQARKAMNEGEPLLTEVDESGSGS
jgi:hypothetical protein